jgi:hypothetical protein
VTVDKSTEDTPVRVCPKCSVQSRVEGDFCPRCGASFNRSAKRKPGKRTALIGGLVLLLLIGAGVGLILKNRHDEQVKQDKAAALAEQQAEAERAQAVAKEEADESERENRRDLITELEKYVKKEAKKGVREGFLDGPILSASCTATGGGSTDDLTARTGTFDCMAVNKENKDGTMSGYGYDGTIDWDTGELTWQLAG